MLPNVGATFRRAITATSAGTFSSSSIRDFDFAGVVMGATLAGDGLSAAVARRCRHAESALPTSPTRVSDSSSFSLAIAPSPDSVSILVVQSLSRARARPPYPPATPPSSCFRGATRRHRVHRRQYPRAFFGRHRSLSSSSVDIMNCDLAIPVPRARFRHNFSCSFPTVALVAFGFFTPPP